MDSEKQKTSAAGLRGKARARLWIGVALLIAGIAALTMDPRRLEAPTPGNLLFVLLSSSGAGLLLQGHPLAAWVGPSFPFWAMSTAAPIFMWIAFAMVMAGLIVTGVRPLLSRKRWTRFAPSLTVANGPLVAVPERVFRFDRGARFLKVAATGTAALALVGCALWLAGHAKGGLAMALAAGIAAMTFALCLWLSSRMRFRVDMPGIHSRVLFGEQSIPWIEVACLSQRHIVFPGLGQTYACYCVLSPAVEITFPATMPRAAELRRLVEQATGLTWPAEDNPPSGAGL
jgi:hypothetical protein